MHNNELQAKLNRELNRAQQGSQSRDSQNTAFQATELIETKSGPGSKIDPRLQPTKSKHFNQRPAVIEDSQPRDGHPVTAMQNIMNDPFSDKRLDEQQPEDGDPASLFPSSPDATHIERKRSHVFTSQTETRFVSRQREIGPLWQSSQSREILDDSDHVTQDLPTTTTGRSKIHAQGIGNTRRELQSVHMTSRPLALRPNAQGPTKRDAAAAGVNSPRPATKKAKRQDSQLEQLGPVIGDSQSPSNPRSLGGRGRKMSTKPGKKTWKGKLTRSQVVLMLIL